MGYEVCEFEWSGPVPGGERGDMKPHACDKPKGHPGQLHECECGACKYDGPDPTAWRKKPKP